MKPPPSYPSDFDLWLARDDSSSPVCTYSTQWTQRQSGQNHRCAAGAGHRLRDNGLLGGRSLPGSNWTDRFTDPVRTALGRHQEEMPRGLESGTTSRGGILRFV